MTTSRLAWRTAVAAAALAIFSTHAVASADETETPDPTIMEVLDSVLADNIAPTMPVPPPPTAANPGA